MRRLITRAVFSATAGVCLLSLSFGEAAADGCLDTVREEGMFVADCNGYDSQTKSAWKPLENLTYDFNARMVTVTNDYDASIVVRAFDPDRETLTHFDQDGTRQVLTMSVREWACVAAYNQDIQNIESDVDSASELPTKGNAVKFIAKYCPPKFTS